MTLPLRPDLVGLEPYGAPQLDVPTLLNVNENPYQPPEVVVEAVVAAVREAAHGLNRYPDRDFLDLRAELAGYLATESGAVGLDASRVWAANGSNEVMLHVLQAFGGPGRVAMSFAPTYSMYPEYARDTLTGWHVVPREPDFSVDPDAAIAEIRRVRPAVVLLASPNNPTGTALPLEVIEAVLGAAPGMVVVDEAYAEFRREGTPSALTLLDGNPRLIVTRTMSKAFAMAGARLGYLAADPAVLDALLLVRLPYHLSAVTQAVARTALAHGEELLGGVDALRRERDDLVAWLRAEGYRVADSDANFVLFGTFPDRRRVWEGLLERGVLIREVGPPEWLRVTVGTPDEMAAFRTALRHVRAGTDPHAPRSDSVGES